MKKLKFDVVLKEGNFENLELESEQVPVPINPKIDNIEKVDYRVKTVKLDANTPIFANKPGER